MNPSNQLRLATMLRAVQDSILPAIRDDAPLAKEQAGLLIGHLSAMMQQDGLERTVDAREWTLLSELARELLVMAEQDPVLAEACDAVAAALAGENRAELGFAIECLVGNTSASASFKSASAKLVMAFSKAHTNLGRAWFLPMGFDGPSAGLPSVQEQLG